VEGVIGTWHEDPTDIQPTQNFEGLTITIASMDESRIPFIMPYPVNTEPDPAHSANYRRDRLIWDNARHVEREFNIVVEEVIHRPNRFENFFATSMAAGSPFADIVHLPPHLILEAAVNQWLYPLCQINLPTSDLLGAQMHSRFTAEAFGQAWAFNANVPYTGAFTLGVNMDILRSASAHCPIELYNAGYWTWDAWLGMLRATTLDTAGHGEITQWGIAGEPYELLMHLVGANDGMLVTDDFRHGFYHTPALEALDFLRTLSIEGLWRLSREISHFPDSGIEWMLTGTGSWGRSISDGNVAFTTGASRYTRRRELPFELAIVPLPTGPSNTTGSTWTNAFSEGFTLPHGSVWQPADLLAVMEAFLSWPGFELELLQETYVHWGNITLEGENAVRQLSAANTRRICLGGHIRHFTVANTGAGSNLHPTNLDVLALMAMGHIQGLEIYVDSNNHGTGVWRNWDALIPYQAVELFSDEMQTTLDLFFR